MPADLSYNRSSRDISYIGKKPSPVSGAGSAPIFDSEDFITDEVLEYAADLLDPWHMRTTSAAAVPNPTDSSSCGGTLGGGIALQSSATPDPRSAHNVIYEIDLGPNKIGSVIWLCLSYGGCTPGVFAESQPGPGLPSVGAHVPLNDDVAEGGLLRWSFENPLHPAFSPKPLQVITNSATSPGTGAHECMISFPAAAYLDGVTMHAAFMIFDVPGGGLKPFIIGSSNAVSLTFTDPS